MIINIITCGVCLLLLIIFRKLDRSNMKMAKLRRYSSKLFDEFKKMAEKESRKFNDATIEMDILIKKSNALAKTINISLGEIEKRLRGLDIEKSNLQKVEEDIKVISQSARDVNKQIEYIADARNSFNDMSKKINGLKDSVKEIRSESGKIVKSFDEKVKEKSDEMRHDFISKINQMKISLEDKESAIVNETEKRLTELTEKVDKAVMGMDRKITDTGEILLQDFKSKIENIAKSVEGASNLDNQIEILKINLAELENSVFSQIREKANGIENEINQSIEKIYSNLGTVETDIEQSRNDLVMKYEQEIEKINSKISNIETDIDDSSNEVMTKFDQDLKKLYDKLNSVEMNINESKDKLIKTFENEVDKVRTELDNLSIHAISKKDEIVAATRKEAEGIRKEIEEFEDKFLEYENRLISIAEVKSDEIERNMEQFAISVQNMKEFEDQLELRFKELKGQLSNTAEEEINQLDSEIQTVRFKLSGIADKLNSSEGQLDTYISESMDRIRDDFSSLEDRLDKIKTEILNYEETSKVFSKTDEMIESVSNSIEDLNRLLNESREEARGLEKFFEDVELIKEMRKNFDREIRSYENKKERLTDIESEIVNLQEISEHALTRAQKIAEEFSKIDAVNSRIDALSDSYANLEARIAELQEYEDVISRNLESVNKADIMIQTVESKLNSFQKIVDRSEKRVDKMNKHLHDIEESTLILKSRESEIKDVKDKFSELEGLSAHMEERIKQIYAMMHKIETLRDEIDTTDNKLKAMFSETDKRMKQFADFIQAVDSNNPILKEVKGSAAPAKNINENVRKTVRDLSDKGWSSDEISKKLGMDESSVKFIINTSTL